MFEVIFYISGSIEQNITCDKGDLLPTMAMIMQDFESKHGKYEHQRNYAIQWRRIKE